MTRWVNDEFVEHEQHAQLRTWLEEFVKSSRSGVPVLFIGQRLVLEPEPGRLFNLSRFGIGEVKMLLRASGIDVTVNGSVGMARLSPRRGLRATILPVCAWTCTAPAAAVWRYDEAERFCKDALASAGANGDLWATGPAWYVLGEIYRDWGRPNDARAAFDQAHQLYEHLGMPMGNIE